MPWRGIQPVGQDNCPGGGGTFTGNRGGGLDRINTGLRRNTKQRQNVGRLWFIIAVPIAHLGVFQNPGGIALFLVGNLGFIFVHFLSSC